MRSSPWGRCRGPLLARVTRGEVVREKEKDYASAARALGKSDFKVLFREILPNVWGPVIVTATMNVGWAILATAAFGFIGVGAQPPHPEWGLMISEGRDYRISNWYLSTLPGTAIFLVVLSLILFGDDNDGYLDTDPDTNPAQQPNALFRNDGDGCLDLYLVNIGEFEGRPGVARLFRNNCAASATGDNWLIVRTVGTRSNRDGIGATITVSAAGSTHPEPSPPETARCRRTCWRRTSA